ncbi:hypothetical protein N7456_005403 [Penicillium angulare]|uniref:Uncharacterized protein n=1 Tax=Penicillium angulare TaxID=116970 RepID=A0A9W9FYD0_9EURO|nr:hypothetical protein N7456_005403 [Penicillium angulare]
MSTFHAQTFQSRSAGIDLNFETLLTMGWETKISIEVSRPPSALCYPSFLKVSNTHGRVLALDRFGVWFHLAIGLTSAGIDFNFETLLTMGWETKISIEVSRPPSALCYPSFLKVSNSHGRLWALDTVLVCQHQLQTTTTVALYALGGQRSIKVPGIDFNFEDSSHSTGWQAETHETS